MDIHIKKVSSRERQFPGGAITISQTEPDNTRTSE
jgi:hypothetical protein